MLKLPCTSIAMNAVHILIVQFWIQTYPLRIRHGPLVKDSVA